MVARLDGLSWVEEVGEPLEVPLPDDPASIATELPPTVERPAETLRHATLDAAEAALAAPLAVFFKLAEAEAVAVQKAQKPPEASKLQQLALSDFGVGKSRAARMAAIGFLQGKQAGRGAPKLSRRVGIMVADLPLADELAAAANQIVPGIAVVRRGVEANDPEAPGQTMCRRLADMKAWIAAGGQPDALCARCAMNPRRRNQDTPEDPGEPGEPVEHCGYKNQDFRGHQIIVMAGPTTLTEAPYQSLKRKLKDAAGKDITMPAFDAAIVDEPKLLSWLGGMEGRATYLDARDARRWQATAATRGFCNPGQAVGDEGLAATRRQA